MPHAVAIVGCGPRGLFAFERLAARLAFCPLDSPVEIHLFNRVPFFGPGENYRPDQPEYLLLNFPISHVDVWPAFGPRPSVRPAPAYTPSFLEWLQDTRPDAAWTPASLVSRACVGRYLSACFEAVAEALPESARLVRHVAEVVDLERVDDGFRLAAEGAPDLPVFSHVLLTTGHTPEQPSDTQQADRAFADAHPGLRYVRHPFPVDAWNEDVPAGAHVALRGFGLTCIDVSLALTEGRGGRFTGDPAAGPLTYHPSGREPARITPFALDGLPPLPKPAGRWPARDLFHPVFFDLPAVERIRDERGGGPLDFRADVWPLLRREMAYACYQAALPVDERDALAAAAESPDAFDTFENDLLDRRPDLERFDWERLVDPRTEAVYASPDAYHAFVVDLLTGWLEEARRGREASPAQAAAEVWNLTFHTLMALVDLGGLTAASHEDFDTAFKGPMARVTYGPPILNAARMLALARAGVLDFGLADGDAVRDEEAGVWRITHDRMPGASRAATWLIEARMPGASVRRDATALFAALRERGLARDFVNRNGETPYDAGGIDLIPGTATVVGADGRPVPGLAAMGWMTEGALLGNDALFREVHDYSDAWAGHVLDTLRRRSAGPD